MPFSFYRLGQLLALTIGMVASAWSASLLSVYEEAKKQDPAFQIAYHTWLAAQSDPDIARSALLPQINVVGDRSFTTYDLRTHESFSTPSHTYGISIDQTLFDWGLWKSYQSTKVGNKIALINLRIAAQSLIYRVTQAYFNVLTSIQTWQTNQKLFHAYKQQFQQTKANLEVGTATKADVYDAKAQADNAKNTLIASKAAMDASIADLYVITGVWHREFKTLKPQLKLNQPQPNHNQAWEALALSQNMDLEAARLAVEQAKYTLQAQQAAYVPTLSVNGSYNRTSDIAVSTSESLVQGSIKAIEFSATQPIFHGGGMIAAMQQAKANLQVAQSSLLQQKRSTQRDAFATFVTLKASIESVKATEEALKSSQLALKTSQASYKAGLNTLTDVLFAISTWNSANIAHIEARYQYLLNILLLKQSVGSLSIHDLNMIDGLLITKVTYPHPSKHYHEQ